MAYAHCPVAVTPGNPSDELAADYLRMVDVDAGLFAAALDAMAVAPPGAVVVHCSGGKDRTGIVTALALAVAGVDEESIVADYLATGHRLALINERNFPKNDPARLARAQRLHGEMSAAAITGVLAHLAATYGGVNGYLRHAGLAPDRLGALRNRLVEPV